MYKKTVTRRNRFLSERVVNPWKELDETFKRKLSEFGY